MGRGSSGAGKNLKKGGSGVNPANISNVRDLVSERERKQAEVDDVLDVAKVIHEEYGIDVGQFMIADIGGSDANTMAFTDGQNITFNSHYFDGKNIDGAYAESVASGFHPSNGNKTAMQAVAAHEYGHVMMSNVAAKLTMTGKASVARTPDSVAKYVVDQAMKKTRHRGSADMAAKISRYATTNYSECVAEAVSDVYCNGKNAAPESRAIVSTINDILK